MLSYIPVHHGIFAFFICLIRKKEKEGKSENEYAMHLNVNYLSATFPHFTVFVLYLYILFLLFSRLYEPRSVAHLLYIYLYSGPPRTLCNVSDEETCAFVFKSLGNVSLFSFLTSCPVLLSYYYNKWISHNTMGSIQSLMTIRNHIFNELHIVEGLNVSWLFPTHHPAWKLSWHTVIPQVLCCWANT